MNLEAKLSKEAEVAEILAFTMDRSAAANKLCISEGTLSAHSYRIYENFRSTLKQSLLSGGL